MSEKITDYGLVFADTPENLEAGVTAAIEDGWQPIGGICFGPYIVEAHPDHPESEPVKVNMRFHQAVVQYDSIVKVLQ